MSVFRAPHIRSPLDDDTTILDQGMWETPAADAAAEKMRVKVRAEELDLLTYVLLTATCCVLGAKQRASLLHKIGVPLAAAKTRDAGWLELAEVVGHIPLIDLMTDPPQEVLEAAKTLMGPDSGGDDGAA